MWYTCMFLSLHHPFVLLLYILITSPTCIPSLCICKLPSILFLRLFRPHKFYLLHYILPLDKSKDLCFIHILLSLFHIIFDRPHILYQDTNKFLLFHHFQWSKCIRQFHTLIGLAKCNCTLLVLCRQYPQYYKVYLLHHIQCKHTHPL